MPFQVRLLGPGDEAVLANVAREVFDHAIDDRSAVEFLDDARHHLAVAIEGSTVVGFASAVHYVHPDKAPELWINEVGVAPSFRRRGVATQLLEALFDLGRKLYCREAWVLTDRDNASAMRLYESLGGHPAEAVMFSFSLLDAGGTATSR